MSLSSEELLNVQNSVLEYHIIDQGGVAQYIQEKPLLRLFQSKMATFVGGRDRTITAPVQLENGMVAGLQAYEFDDAVGYDNPAKQKRVSAQWREFHIGIECTETELKMGGITINDQMRASYSEGELVALRQMLDDKAEDMSERAAIDLNALYWADGSSSPKVFPGVLAYIQDDPTSPLVVGGIDQGAQPKWRNRVSLGLSTTTPSDMVIIKKLQSEMRQLRRFGRGPNVFLAGSAILDAVEAEVFSKGVFTQSGWASANKIDIGQADKKLDGIVIEYDPTLDDIGRSKYLYALDISKRGLVPFVIAGENMKQRKPVRSHDRYTYLSAITHTCGLLCRGRNTSGVYSIA